jgi:hypothetical protein
MGSAKQQIEGARRVLYNLAPDGTIISKTELYQMYERNAAAYAKAKSDYAAGYAKASSSPMTLQTWPLTATTYQQAIDTAWNSWTSAGKDKVEHALAVIQSQPKN